MQENTTQHQLPADILIKGGGIVGQTLALLLAQEGYQIAISENNLKKNTASDPRAYALNHASVELLKALRVWSEEEACPIYDMQVMGDEGGELLFSAWQQKTSTLTHIVPASTIEQKLNDALQFQQRIHRIAEDQVETFAAQVPLIAICEGRDSPTRAQFGFESHTIPYGHRALAAHLLCEQTHDFTARQWFHKGILALLPLAGEAQNRVGLVWSLPEEKAVTLQDMSTEQFEDQLTQVTQHTLGALQLKTPIVGWDLRYSCAKNWIKQHRTQTAVLLGDAAHTMHPLAGQGLNTGLGDVIQLVKCIQSAPEWRQLNDTRLLRTYERARKSAFLKMGGGCDLLFHLFDNEQPLIKALRNQGMNAINTLPPFKNWLATQARG